MKKIISVVCALALAGSVVFAQENTRDKRKGRDDWREKVRAEQVSLITSELDLTEAQAQAFWPVYNSVQVQRREAFKASADAMKALKNADNANVNALLDNYLAAKKAAEAVEEEAIAKYRAVLPAEKVAKLILAEEKFRHQQIGRLGGHGGPQKGAKPGNGWQGPRRNNPAAQEEPAA